MVHLWYPSSFRIPYNQGVQLTSVLADEKARQTFMYTQKGFKNLQDMQETKTKETF
jgi:hypothetical protein